MPARFAPTAQPGRIGHDVEAAAIRQMLEGARLVSSPPTDDERQRLAAGLGDLVGAVKIVPSSGAAFGLGGDRDVGASRAARSAIASPMPREAPVMKSGLRDAIQSSPAPLSLRIDAVGAFDHGALEAAGRDRDILREEPRQRDAGRRRRCRRRRCAAPPAPRSASSAPPAASANSRR